MTIIETRRYEMLVRVREFGETHRDRFPESSVGGQAFATVAAAVQQLSDEALSKLLAAREGKSTKARARAALIDRLDAISRTARVLAEDTPGLDDTFQRRRAQTDQALLTTGRAFAHDAEAFESEFVGQGLPDTFIADLHDRVETFAQSIRHREAGRDGHAAARAGIAAALSSGFAAVRRLDVLMANTLRDDPVTMAVWDRDRRVAYPNRARSAGPAALPPPPAGDPSRPGGTGIDSGAS